jgi:mono/diheme cytochrome c family protein
VQKTAKLDGRSAGSGNAARLAFCLLLSAYCLLAAAGCRRDMQDQPKMKPYRSSPFFRDGISSRPPVEGTVARGFLKTDTEFFTGKKSKASSSGFQSFPRDTSNGVITGTPAPATGPQPTAATGAAPQGAAAYPDDVEVFPIQVTRETVIRGKQRYEIFCTACHGLTGNGDGMIVRRGFRRAASFNDDRLRQAPVGHFFDAITNGWGAMPSYAPQIPPQDRWAIVAYIRALQLSQAAQQPSGSPEAKGPTPQTPKAQPGEHQQ